MRISGYGAGFGQQQPGDRAATFKRQHSIGQRVKGRILRQEAGGLMWVQVGGAELLARLEVDAQPGDELFFIVRALEPEIVLQALPRGAGAVDLPGLAQRFRAAREVFESRDGTILTSLSALPALPSRLAEAFDAAISGNAERQDRLSRIHSALVLMNAALPGSTRVVYEPWLLPVLRRSEGFRRGLAAGASEWIAGGVEADCGGVEFRLLADGSSLRLTLAAERPERTGPLQVQLFSLIRAEHGRDPEMLAPTRLRPDVRGGVLGRLFPDDAPWSAGGLNARV